MSNALESSWFTEKFSKDSATCAASSRVGASIKERGILAFAMPASKISIIGNVNEAVFPVPVWAEPITSLPIKTMGIAFS